MFWRRFRIARRKTGCALLTTIVILCLVYALIQVFVPYNIATLRTHIRLRTRKSVRLVDVFRLYDYRPRVARLSGNESERLLCWVLTHPRNHPTRLPLIRKTWSPRCDKTLFFSSCNDSLREDWPIISLNVTGNETKKNNALKAKRAWEHVYDYYRDHFDWFMKTDDDTYLVVENLRQFIATLNTSARFFYGRQFVINNMHLEPKDNASLVFMSGGAGLLLSRASLDLLVERGIRNGTGRRPTRKCMPHGAGEDWKVSRCLQWSGAQLGESRDAYGRQRFNCFRPERHLDTTRRMPNWFYKYDRFGVTLGRDCCADYPVSFHYMHREHFEELDRFLYNGSNVELS